METQESVEAASINVGALSQLRAPAAREPEPPTSNGQSLPAGIQRWSWGAFLLNAPWAISNRIWWGAVAALVPLFVLLPWLGLPIWFLLGFKGRAWAWRKRQWQSFEHFEKVQRRWTVSAVTLYVSVAVLLIVLEALGNAGD